MTIPPERLEAANWVYQFTVLSFAMTILSVPYNAAIIAHENMKVYAYVSIYETVMKLAVVFLLLVFSCDKLSLYGFLIFCVNATRTLFYWIYCNVKYKECRLRFTWERQIFMSLVGYSGWNIVGSISGVLKDQGANVLLNIFFNPIVNAARGIAYQINSAILQLTNNFYTAIRPQITKSYAGGSIRQMHDLVFQSAKLAFFLLMAVPIPILLETEFIFSLWLGTLPQYVVMFSRLVIINSLIDVINLPMVAAVQATGRIMLYQLTVSIILLMNLPVAYLMLSAGYPPQYVFYTSIAVSLVSFVPRLVICRRVAGISIPEFFRSVIVRIVPVFLISISLPLAIRTGLQAGVMRVAVSICSCAAVSTGAVFFIGLSGTEKRFLHRIIKNKILKRAGIRI